MKELSMEQKARRYDEAKYIMKEYLESGNAGVIAENTIKNAFPELSESEDEKIRKDIVTYLKSILSNKKYGDKFIEDWIVWLEKHADKVEQKHTPKHKVGDTIYYNSFGELKSMIVANVITGGTDNPMYEDGNGNAVFEKDLIEHNLAWCEEDENTIQVLKNIVRHSDEIDENIYTMSLKEKLYDWLKSIKNRVHPKHEWKQENTDDLTDFENAMMHIGGSFFGENAGLDPNDTNAIKEQANLLLELVPKQEWSEEDENNILFLTAFIEECFKGKEKITLCGDTMCANFTKEDVIERLKSIRPQWKPSKEQMKTLEIAIRSGIQLGSWEEDSLKSLARQLMKLR